MLFNIFIGVLMFNIQYFINIFYFYQDNTYVLMFHQYFQQGKEGWFGERGVNVHLFVSMFVYYWIRVCLSFKKLHTHEHIQFRIIMWWASYITSLLWFVFKLGIGHSPLQHNFLCRIACAIYYQHSIYLLPFLLIILPRHNIPLYTCSG